MIGKEGELGWKGTPCPTVEVVDARSISEEWIEKEKRIEAASEDLQGKPEQILEKIVTGRVEKAMKAKLLIEQPYIRDTNMSVEELVKSYIAKLGENIQIARFVRFNVGELQSARGPHARAVVFPRRRVDQPAVRAAA